MQQSDKLDNRLSGATKENPEGLRTNLASGMSDKGQEMPLQVKSRG